MVTLDYVPFTEIPLHIRGGVVLPLRIQSAMTTKVLRTRDFEFVVAPGIDGTATGQLYVDDGVSLNQPTTTDVMMNYKNGLLTVSGQFGYATGVQVSRIRFLGVTKAPVSIMANYKVIELGGGQVSYDGTNKVLDVSVGLDFTEDFTVLFA